jgi:oligopeptide transport system ATP-binding protein
LLSIDKASVSYREPGRGELHAVREASLSLKEGETLAIVGESGSGKSSLVRGLLGLVPLSNSTFMFDGQRRDMQMVFQDPVGSLNPQMRVAEIVAEPLRVHARDLRRSECRERVVDMLSAVGLDEALLNRYPHQLSGGQAQRVAIARALMLNPRVLVCDEAVAALDSTVRNKILDLLRELQASMGLSIIFIAHDLAVVRSISHRIIVMYLGRVVEVADNAALFNSPQHPYTRALLDAVPVPDPTSRHVPTPLVGEIPSAFTPPSGCAFHSRCPEAIEQCKAAVPELRTLKGRKVACIRINDVENTR